MKTSPPKQTTKGFSLERRVGRIKVGTSRRRANSARNSECAYPLDWLDWSCWWTDNTGGGCYLHVRGWHPDDPQDDDHATWHRVYCRATESPRLRLEGGVLYWLIDSPNGLKLSDSEPATRLGRQA